jgi:hypothetical protein
LAGVIFQVILALFCPLRQSAALSLQNVLFLLQKTISVDGKPSPANSQASVSSVGDHYPGVPRIPPEEVLKEMKEYGAYLYVYHHSLFTG